MLALTDAALARICIVATAVPPSQRGRWLRQIANELDGDEHGSRTPAAKRAAERLCPRLRSRQIQTGSVGARLGRKSVREHQRLSAAVPVGRITPWSVRGPLADARLRGDTRGRDGRRSPRVGGGRTQGSKYDTVAHDWVLIGGD